MTAYYAQFRREEILPIHGIEVEDTFDDEECYVEDQDDEENEVDQLYRQCPRCTHGCDYCV